jgi:predicted DNA-binding protein with PD1-like motif
MHTRVLNHDGKRTIGFVFEGGDEPISELTHYAAEHELASSRFAATGTLDTAMLGYFDCDRKTYHELAIAEPVEVLSLVGDIALDGKHRRVHAHVVLGKRDGSTCEGYLLRARAEHRLDVVLVETPDSSGGDTSMSWPGDPEPGVH